MCCKPNMQLVLYWCQSFPMALVEDCRPHCGAMRRTVRRCIIHAPNSEALYHPHSSQCALRLSRFSFWEMHAGAGGGGGRRIVYEEVVDVRLESAD